LWSTGSCASGLDTLQELIEFLEDNKIAEFAAAEYRLEKIITGFR